MPQWYAIKIDPHNSTMCTLLYKRLRDGLCCEGLVRNSNVSKTITEAYVQIVKDSRGWRYVGLYAYESSLQYQTLVLTANEFYSRFLQHTVTL